MTNYVSVNIPMYDIYKLGHLSTAEYKFIPLKVKLSSYTQKHKLYYVSTFLMFSDSLIIFPLFDLIFQSALVMIVSQLHILS